jgi:hypothetical protein
MFPKSRTLAVMESVLRSSRISGSTELSSVTGSSGIDTDGWSQATVPMGPVMGCAGNMSRRGLSQSALE